MPLQNRVLPTGEIVAVAAKGDLMGNRGILHDHAQRLGKRRWQHQNWVACALEFKGRCRKLMQPGRYTELFFLDEAVSLAAGHRPCAECRRADYKRYRAAWEQAFGPIKAASEMDSALHAARVNSYSRQQITHEAALDDLPDGTFIDWNGAPHLVLEDRLLRYTPGGYDAAVPRPGGVVTVLTPGAAVTALAQGYRPGLHHTAGNL